MASGLAHAEDVRTIKIAFSVDVLDDTQNAATQAMHKRVDELNASRKDVKIEFDVYDAQGSVDKQISDVQTALIKQPNVLIFSAVDSVGSLPAMQAAKDAGVPILDRRPTSPVSDLTTVAFYSSDENRYSKATTEWIKGYLKAHPDSVLKIGAIYGAPAQTAQLLRIDAIKALAAEMPDRIQFVAEGYGNWLTATAQNLSQDWLLAYPDINYIATANDIMALGVSNTLISAGRKDILVSGYDLTPDGVQRVKDGTQSLTIGTSIADNGKTIDVALGIVDGSFKDKTYYLDPVYAVDAGNVDDFLAGKIK
ncbi:sugar ABC transporter substrate-binding protein [Kaistia terrae]|uniref:Sugar ABC transporter substrate-binding protein n=1 Tax=Kaistia terrae TaxID=537017 RepID=A0ABW0PP68_9HYPH|nr:sugar ABC transporter substrate-binding protein [Kaistia terrae]MCX5577675.1 sugar ABC transporter substrate-binding protein [Kaistia terrae]